MVYKSPFFKGSIFGVRDAQQKGRTDGGIRVYLDGFRVFPYGDPGDDWLQLDYYAARNIDIAPHIKPSKIVADLAGTLYRPYLLIPKNQQVFGVVAISQTKHTGIEINVTRDRLLETGTFLQLRRFIQNGIYWMTMRYAAFVAEQNTQKEEEREKTTVEIIEDTKAEIEAQTELSEDQKQSIVANLGKAADQARQDEAKRISEISMLQILASAGTTVLIMDHQLQALVGGIIEIEQDLLRLKSAIPEHIYDDYADTVQHIEEWRKMVELQVAQLGFLLAPNNRQRRGRYALYEIVDNVKNPMLYYMNKYGVSFENRVPRNIRTPPIYQSELYAVLINILSNALKAVFGQPDRRIAVIAERAQQSLYIRMLDTGVGVPHSRRESSFQPFVSTSVPNPLLGVGTGMGLKVVRDILGVYSGTARFIDTEEPWRTCIEIILPDQEASNG